MAEYVQAHTHTHNHAHKQAHKQAHIHTQSHLVFLDSCPQGYLFLRCSMLCNYES